MKRYNITVNGTAYDVTVDESDSSAPAAAPIKKAAPAAKPAAAQGGVAVESPIPGTIVDMKVAVGSKVTNGMVVAILEALKMENEIFATCDGTVASVNVDKGQSVETGTVILTINT